MRSPRLLSVALTALVLAGCAESRTPVDPDLGLPAARDYRGRLQAGHAARDTASIVIPVTRSGVATVRVCAPEAVQLELRWITAGDTTTRTVANCEAVTMPVRAGEVRRIRVRALSGEGHFNACYTLATTGCAVQAPYPYPWSVPVGYYDLAEGKTGQALRLALHQIVSAGHRVFDYTTARDSLYAVVDDPFDRDTIADIFVGRPEHVYSRATAADVDFNAEHTWPQSRGAGELPAQSDLHTLHSGDETANTTRSNHPWGRPSFAISWQSSNPGDTAGISRLGVDSVGRTVFEIRDPKKGDIARAQYYFFIRYYYDRTPSFSLQNFNVEKARHLVWSQTDPPDAFERARHERVFRVQRNRNPFIDRPEWMTAVGPLPES